MEKLCFLLALILQYKSNMAQNMPEIKKRSIKKFLSIIRPRFSLHYVSYTILIGIIIFSVVNVVHASLYSTTTPNPGHPWDELGYGAFQFTNDQTAFRTYTLPDADANILTDNATITVPEGGTGVATLTGIVKGNGAAAFSAATAGTDYQIPISLTTIGNNSASTFNTSTGALNVPNYTLAGLGGISLTGLSASSPLSYNNTTGAFSIQVANTSQGGYLNSTDWNTFNSSYRSTNFVAGTDYQIPISLTVLGSSGASTFNTSTGALNIPTYTLAGLGGQPAGSYLTSIAITSANGFAGSSSGGTTPSLTITTSISGLLKGNGTAISAATAGTDYQIPISLTTIGNNSASTFNTSTGALNVPNYTLAGLGGISLTGLSASSPLSYNNTTGAFSIQVANTSQGGYLNSTDWNTFNSSYRLANFVAGTDYQIPISLTVLGSSGASTFNTSTGALNIPTYTLAGSEDNQLVHI